MNELLMAIDANHLGRRVYHIGESNADETRKMYAVYEFYSYMLRLDSAYHPSKVIMAWDAPPYFRTNMYTAYKANRDAPEGNWVTQLHWMKKIAEMADIAQVSVSAYEADDVLATIAKVHPNTIIVTGDKDLLALVTNGTTVELLRWTKAEGTHRKRFSSRIDVKEFLGVFPEQLLTYKALSGDASDNIPGVNGIGHKKAVDLIERYGTLEGIYEHLRDLVKKDGSPLAIAKNLHCQREQTLLFREICTTALIERFEMPQARSLNIKAITDGLKEMEHGAEV